MFEKINADIKDAMKKKEKERLEALRFLKSLLLQNKTSKTPIPEIDVLTSHYKKMEDSQKVFPADSPQVQKIRQELKFLKIYMPEEMTEMEVKELIIKLIDEMETPNLGAIMKSLSPKIKGRFDGKKASELVRKLIS